MSACRSCGAPVRWVRMSGGRAIPLDPQPNAAGNVTLDADGVAYIGRNTQPGARYVMHFATCPDAADWRRP